MWMCRHCVSVTCPPKGASGVVLHDHYLTTELFFHGVSNLLDIIHTLSMSPLLRDWMWRDKGYGEE